ncbi:NAD-dependent epimerase/dehydratase family protein [candidate division WOR-3 bacterium]|uniref:NAD-dependent epimerase/dehydratase family protein n=1 Tax=candidate division WOR-3 bacterium TaxID=2052148 RepID=A0A9D5KC53_UNCW3|nr:NAD-dependent epimerase/dehydratase family protein [candidate division WOR-3 bacterium]MBD3365350.1 NAD-dependent epimerase/dehydratase family protein [candidate division WOR-3 bacterium]
MKKVLVTGASGILGSHFCDALHEAGYEVHGLIRKASSRQWIDNPWLKVHVGTLDDEKALARTFRGIKTLIHNAGVNHGSAPELCRKVNLEGTKTVARAAVNAGVSRFIYISSRSAAGPNYGMFIRTEQDRDNPHEPYGQSKLDAEGFLKGLREKMEIVSLRYALMYGPRDTHLLPVFKMLSAPVHPISGYRSIYTPLLFLHDAARAGVAVVSAKRGTFESGSYYYVSDGIPYSVETMCDLILAGMGRKSMRIRIPLWAIAVAAWFASRVVKSHPEFTPDAVRDMRAGSRLVSPERFMNDFGWRPKVPPHKAFHETVAWYRKMGWLP